ncbi:MAG: AAA family ATPase [Pyrinomonadaceae bacterium]
MTDFMIAGHSLLLVGNAGIGTSALLKVADEELKSNGARTIKIVPNSVKQILVSLAFQLNLYSEDDKLPTSPRLQKGVAESLQRQKSIISIDEANRLTVVMQMWLEALHENGYLYFWKPFFCLAGRFI